MKSFQTYVEESKRGLWDNIHAKRERIKRGSGERMRKPGSKGAPTADAFKQAQMTSESAEQLFDIIEQLVDTIAIEEEIAVDEVWEQLETVTDEELAEAATADAKGYKSKTGGLTQKGRDYYNRKEGSHLKPPVTTPPSKLDPDSKAAKRRKSFCARMSGVEGPMKKPNGEPTRKALALRKWNC